MLRTASISSSFLTSLTVAAISTLITLLIAFPFALALARASRRLRPILIALAVAPFWTSFLIGVYAWIALLKDEGLINHALMTLGLIREPLGVYATNVAVVIGIVYSYLPFMLLPLYSALERQDPSLREAAADLGATPTEVFKRVTLPLSRRGVIAGCLLVFIPAVGEFVIPDLLGGSDSLMIGRTIWNDFFANRDWPAASAAAIVLLLLLLGPLLLAERVRLKDERRSHERDSATCRPRGGDARICLSLWPDPGAGRDELQRLAARDGLGRLLHTMVPFPPRERGAARTRRGSAWRPPPSRRRSRRFSASSPRWR